MRNNDSDEFFPVRRGYVPDALTVDAVLAVVRYGGMNKAAHHLGVSQQVVSTRISKLEMRLGQRIFGAERRVASPQRRGAGSFACSKVCTVP